MHYPGTRDYPEALVKILLMVMEKGRGGTGATLDDLKQAYQEIRGDLPSNKTIYRAIRRLNLLFDPLAYGERGDGEADDLDERELSGKIELFPPVIQARRTQYGTRYFFTGEIPGSSIDANNALLLLLGLYTQQRGLLKGHFEAIIGELLRDSLQRLRQDNSILGEMERYIHVSGYGPAEPFKSLSRIKEIMRAVSQCKRIRLEYFRTYDGTLTRREIEPYGLISRFNNWYLVARCLQQQKRRVFSLDHIRRLEVMEASVFRRPADFSLRRIYGQAWGVWTQEEEAEPEMVRIRVVKGLAERFRVISYHDSQSVKILHGGTAEVTYNVTGAREMIPWLMSWGSAVQVLQPAWLRLELQETLQNTLSCYQADAKGGY